MRPFKRCALTLAILLAFYVLSLTPVSYTHLDVYKRQPIILAIFSSPAVIAIDMANFPLSKPPLIEDWLTGSGEELSLSSICSNNSIVCLNAALSFACMVMVSASYTGALPYRLRIISAAIQDQ